MPSAIHASINNLQKGKKTISTKDPFKESIYSWAPKESPVSASTNNIADAAAAISKSGPYHAKYRSKYADQARKEFKLSQISKAATMGPLHVAPENPKKFLHSHAVEERIQKIAHDKKEKYELEPQIQARLSKEKSHLQAPIWEPKYPKETPYIVPKYPKKGERRSTDLDSYRAKQDYGKVPHYLSKRREEMVMMAEAEKELQKAKVKVPTKGLVPLAENERQQILAGLQQQWNDLTVEFQKLPLVIDTVPKINRKLALENRLKQIEADIEKFSRSNVMVYLG